MRKGILLVTMEKLKATIGLLNGYINNLLHDQQTLHPSTLQSYLETINKSTKVIEKEINNKENLRNG
jgi:hypothetical protein